MDGALDLGLQGLHPVQASAGMDPVRVKQEYGGVPILHGGLDGRTVLGRGDPDGVCR